MNFNTQANKRVRQAAPGVHFGHLFGSNDSIKKIGNLVFNCAYKKAVEINILSVLLKYYKTRFQFIL